MSSITIASPSPAAPDPRKILRLSARATCDRATAEYRAFQLRRKLVAAADKYHLEACLASRHATARGIADDLALAYRDARDAADDLLDAFILMISLDLPNQARAAAMIVDREIEAECVQRTAIFDVPAPTFRDLIQPRN